MTPTATNDLERLQVIEIMLMDKHKHIQEVADHLGISRVRLWQICKANGINPHRPIKRVCVCGCEREFKTTRGKVRSGGGKYFSRACYHSHQRFGKLLVNVKQLSRKG